MEVDNKKILITGGMGNLGSWLTHYFCEKAYSVTIVTKRERKLEFDSKYGLILCDIADIDQIRERIDPEAFDIVIHAASVNDGFVDNYFHDALIINTLGTRNILEVFKDRFKGHFIYFSTFQVYGKYAGTITEETAPAPKNDYGNTHLFSEFYLKQFGQTHNFPYSIVRLTNSYGCPKDLNSSKWYLILNDLSKTAFEEEKIVLRSNGKAVRDFIWMKEVCELVEKLGNHEPTRDVFNISGEKTFSMLDIAHFVKSAFKKKFGREIPILVNENDTTEPSELLVKSGKIRELLSYGKYEEKFEEESMKILDLLSKK